MKYGGHVLDYNTSVRNVGVVMTNLCRTASLMDLHDFKFFDNSSNYSNKSITMAKAVHTSLFNIDTGWNKEAPYLSNILASLSPYTEYNILGPPVRGLVHTNL